MRERASYMPRFNTGKAILMSEHADTSRLTHEELAAVLLGLMLLQREIEERGKPIAVGNITPLTHENIDALIKRLNTVVTINFDALEQVQAEARQEQAEED